MIHIHELEKQFGERVLFRELSWHIAPGERIGLVGANGAGKTTLCRILAGSESADGGTVSRAKRLKVGFLEQEVDAFGASTVLEGALEAFGEVLSLREEIAGIEAAFQGRDSAPDPARMRVLGELQSRLEELGGYAIEARAKKVLGGLGFDDAAMERSLSELSGGYMMRVALARILLEQPDLLLLDEPTNHLDLDSLEWFEAFLLEYPGTLVVISHDRWFLNRIVNRIAELSHGGMTLYTGNYDAFLREREEREALLEKQHRQQSKEIAKTEAFIEKFRSKATKAKAVQSRVKALEKMERIELRGSEQRVSRFQFPAPERSGRVVAELSGVQKAYGEHRVYEDLNLLIERGQRVALVGANGAGKSTLLKLLAGRLSVDGGSFALGHKVEVEYFAQHQLESLVPSRTVFEEMESGAHGDTITRLRSLLGAFLFSGDDVDKRVSVLSGGEKSRLALAKMLLQAANFLLLDEPTNHLDIASREMLEGALLDFPGTLCFISHDRYFLRKIANVVVEIGDGRATVYPGDYAYYLYKREQQDKLAAPVETEREGGGGAPTLGRKERKRREAELRNAASRDLRPMKQALEEAERLIAQLEGRLEEIVEMQEDERFFEDAQRMEEIYREQAEKSASLEQVMERWAVVGEEIEAREEQLKAAVAELT